MRLPFVLYMISFVVNPLYSEALYRTTPPSTDRISPSSYDSNAVTQKRLTCSENAFNFTIEFERPFSGLIYTEGAESSPRCVYVDGTSSTSTASRTQFQFLIPADGCGSITTRNGTVFQTTNTFLVQRDQKLIELNDNAFTVVCQRYYPTNRDPDENAVAAAVTMIYERFEVIGPTEEVITRSVNEVLGREVQFGTRLALGEDPDGPLPDRPVQLGEKLTYVFYCSTNTTSERGARDCSVGECVATDPSGTKRVQLSDQNGCSKHPSVWSNFIAHDLQLRNGGVRAKRVLLARLSAWSFPTSSHVLISCKARSCDDSCQGGPTTCARPPAAAPPPPPRDGGARGAGFDVALNDTAALVRSDEYRLANDAVDASDLEEDRGNTGDTNEKEDGSDSDSIVIYKIDRSTGPTRLFANPNNKRFPIPPPRHDGQGRLVAAGEQQEALSLPEMITADTPRSALPLPDSERHSTGPTAPDGVTSAANRKCLSMDTFVGLLCSLLIAVGVLSFVIGFLMWKLHNTNRRATVVRIEKRGCPF